MKNHNRCSRLYLFFAAAFTLCIAAPANAALYSRLNGLAVYDSDLNITWTADANLPASLSFGLTFVQPNGSMLGDYADNWITALNTYQGTGYLGFNDWRLTIDNCADTAGYNCTDSEFGYLFYNELGGVAGSTITSGNNPNLALFTNVVENNWYWTGSIDVGHIRVFNFGDGSHSRTYGSLAQFQVWAVRDGDVAAVPLPAAVWLFGSGFVGLLGTAWHKKARND